ncbi:hypothetical protein, partial [Streptomyces sp. NPDC057582]|uniref:hypothetical protein n=1 Tax=Streptomyces sp. NPDC057582 TaxID=3346174 RepID=UPI0036991CE6
STHSPTTSKRSTRRPRNHDTNLESKFVAQDTRPPQPSELSVWPGFAEIRDLPGKPVHVTLVFRNQRGATVLDRQISTTPQPSYPNGRNCSPGGHQARLMVTEEGSLIPR